MDSTSTTPEASSELPIPNPSSTSASFPIHVTERFKHHHPDPAPILAWLNRSIDNLRDALQRSSEFNRLLERRQQLREFTRDFYVTTREQFLQHPFVERLRQDSQRMAVNFYKRALPFLSQIARNSFLTGASAFLLGLLVARIFFPSSRYKCPMKPQRMKAIVCDARRYDGLESLKLNSDYERPRILSADQVLIRVQAASVDPTDVLVLSGLCRNERQTNNNGDSESDPGIVLGRDFSGTVVEVGLRVNTFKVGDGVWSALPLAVNGALCEYVVLPASQVRLKPSHFGHDSCCTLPYSSLLTWQALVSEGGLQPDQSALTVALVVDGTSSTGCIALQLLSAWSAQVVTCVPYRVAPLAHMLGADHIIPITPADVDAEEKCRHALVNSPQFDLIVMTREDGLLSEEFCQNYLKDGGKIVKTYPQRINSDSYGFLRRYLLSYLRKIVAPYHSLDVTPLDYIRRLVDMGQLQPVLDSTYSYEDYEDAFHTTAAQANIGKSVVSFNAK